MRGRTAQAGAGVGAPGPGPLSLPRNSLQRLKCLHSSTVCSLEEASSASRNTALADRATMDNCKD